MGGNRNAVVVVGIEIPDLRLVDSRNPFAFAYTYRGVMEGCLKSFRWRA
jgi:hypothetical protein